MVFVLGLSLRTWAGVVVEVWEVDPESLTDAALAVHVRELDAERCRVEAAMAKAVAAADARERVGLRRGDLGCGVVGVPV